MKRVYLLVEGQTEEAFVKELLEPHYARQQIYLTPIIVSTSPGHKGGVVSYAKIRPQIERLCMQDAGAIVTTMFDLYALPVDFPGRSDKHLESLVDGDKKARFLEGEMSRNIARGNFIPNLLVHEFEALLFSGLDAFTGWVNDDAVLGPLYEVRAALTPENINDGYNTAPSKRILSAMPDYQKPVHGPLIACDIGLDAMRRDCPHFDSWLKTIETL